ncbi:MAG: hypothetical protein ACLFP8_03540 [Alphaproteobacteria bacterium]
MCARRVNFVFFAVIFILALVAGVAMFSGEWGIRSAYAEVSEEAKEKSRALGSQVGSFKRGLDQSEVTHFGIIYSNYSVYSMVRAVRDDVAQAVEKCIENNPEMEEDISARWDEWSESVGSSLKDVMDNINAMVKAQDYAPENEIRRLLSMVDDTRLAGASNFDKVPVTTPEACEFMISKMDETEQQMNLLLAATLQSYSLILRKMQE